MSWRDYIKKKKNNEANYGKGNIDLNNRPVVKNSDGSISTVRSMSFYDDKEKKEILVPTVVNGKIVSDDEAIKHYYNTGEYLGKFDTPKEADKYAIDLHKQQEKLYSNNTNILEESDARQNQQKFTPQKETSEQNAVNKAQMATQNILRQNQQNLSTWDKVKATMMQTGNDISNIGKNFGLGVTSSSKNALYYIENMSENKFGEYKRYNQQQSALVEKRKQNEELTKGTGKINLADMKLPTNPNERNIKQLSEEEKKQILLPKKQESLILKNIDESITKDEEQIQKNVESTSNKVLRKVAELTPSIAQSVTGMGASVVNPALRIRILANICWRWIHKRSRKEWLYRQPSYAIWYNNG